VNYPIISTNPITEPLWAFPTLAKRRSAIYCNMADGLYVCLSHLDDQLRKENIWSYGHGHLVKWSLLSVFCDHWQKIA